MIWYAFDLLLKTAILLIMPLQPVVIDLIVEVLIQFLSHPTILKGIDLVVA